MPEDEQSTPVDDEIASLKRLVSGGEEISASEKREIIEKVVKVLQPPPEADSLAITETTSDLRPAQVEPPWTLQQFFDGEIDLDAELSTRFQNMPMMTNIKFRDLGTHTNRGVATVATSDGSAQVVFDADKTTKVVQLSFTFGSMLTLRFTMRELSDMDRNRWLELMRRQEGGLAFLWGPSRWEEDYLICISRRYFTNLYAFSPNGFEAALRMTPDVIDKLLGWLEGYWHTDDDDKDDDEPQMLTW
jgi:hypothetical protein